MAVDKVNAGLVFDALSRYIQKGDLYMAAHELLEFSQKLPEMVARLPDAFVQDLIEKLKSEGLDKSLVLVRAALEDHPIWKRIIEFDVTNPDQVTAHFRTLLAENKLFQISCELLTIKKKSPETIARIPADLVAAIVKEMEAQKLDVSLTRTRSALGEKVDQSRKSSPYGYELTNTMSLTMLELPKIVLEGTQRDPFTGRDVPVFDYVMERVKGRWKADVSAEHLQGIESHHKVHPEHSGLVMLGRGPTAPGIKTYEAWAVAKIISCNPRNGGVELEVQMCSPPSVDYRGVSAKKPQP